MYYTIFVHICIYIYTYIHRQSYINIYWLVVWNMFSIYWEESSQLTNIVQRGGSTTNQSMYMYMYMYMYICICIYVHIYIYIQMYLGDNHHPLWPSLLIPAQRRLLGARHGRELFQALDVGGEGSLSVKEVAIVDVRKQRTKRAIRGGFTGTL